MVDDTTRYLKDIFSTKNQLTIPLSGTGSAGMDACLMNMIEQGDKVVICVNGLFGQRMVDMATRNGEILALSNQCKAISPIK